MAVKIEESWRQALEPQFEQPYFKQLIQFVKEEYARGPVYPAGSNIFRAFDLTPFDQVKVVILGQDPYHGAGQAHGLAFSVNDGVPFPPSLRNIFKELHDDVGAPIPRTGNLSRWAEQGVLLLNAVLTVRAGEAFSHQGKGWEQFTDAVIHTLAERRQQLAFVLWGSPAQKKAAFVDSSRHKIIKSVHPSPLAASRGFFGSKPFSQVNQYLEETGQTPINW